MSIHYNVAAALRYGDFAEKNYVPQQNPDVLMLASTTRLEVDDELTKAFPGKQGAEVIVQTRAGDELRERVDNVVPTSADGVRARFAAAAQAAFGDGAAAHLRELVDGLEHVADAAELSRATRPGSAATSGASAPSAQRTSRSTRNPARGSAAAKTTASSKPERPVQHAKRRKAST
jgi:hypothetical protein